MRNTPVIDAHVEIILGLSSPAPEPFRYRSALELVNALGTAFSPVLGAELGPPKQCFKNAGRMVLESPARYAYVEGFAVVSEDIPLPVAHAWVWDIQERKAVEVTWESVGSEYLGVPFAVDFVRGMALARGVWGILDAREMLLKEADPKKFLLPIDLSLPIM